MQLSALGYKVFNVVTDDNENELRLPKVGQVSDRAQISNGDYILSFNHGKINLKVDGTLMIILRWPMMRCKLYRYKKLLPLRIHLYQQ